VSSCRWCRLPESEHRTGLIDHTFQPEASGRAQVSVSPFAGDPVLRRALVDKGVLTLADLRRAEAKIRTMSEERPHG
jgi:hypothetical protein